MPALNYELENAFLSLLNPVADPAQGYTGRNSKDKLAPCFICQADGDGDEDPKNSGNYWHDVIISVKQSAAIEQDGLDPTPGNVSLVTAIWNQLQVLNLDALLNLQGRTLTVFPQGVLLQAQKSGWDELGYLIDEYHFRVYCCGSVLPP